MIGAARVLQCKIQSKLSINTEAKFCILLIKIERRSEKNKTKNK